MTTQSHYTLELEQTARKHIQTPVSYIGGYKMLWHRDSGALGKIGWGTVLVLYWLFVTTMFYMLMLGFMATAFVWLLYTQARRHRIRDARTALATRDQHIGSAGPA